MLKLGVIGMSEGNGHPYSWSAIINGYNKEAMASCPFPVIPDYLGKQTYPDDFIKGAQVTHIWTQDRAISEHVAKASKIAHIVEDYKDMIGQVDAILMARDDYKNHETFAVPFIEAGLSIYIDKPLANTVKGAQSFFDRQKSDTQIFTCSALRYARELEPFKENIGKISSISAHTPKSWSLYGIHIVEPVMALLGTQISLHLEKAQKAANGEEVLLKVPCTHKGEGNVIDLSFKSAGIAKGTINFVIGFNDGTSQEVVIGDMFYAFRSALERFIRQVQTKELSILREQTMMCMSIIQAGK